MLGKSQYQLNKYDQLRVETRDELSLAHWLGILKRGYIWMEHHINTPGSGILSVSETVQLLKHIGWVREKDCEQLPKFCTTLESSQPLQSQVSKARIVLLSPRQLDHSKIKVVTSTNLLGQVIDTLDVDDSGFISLEDLLSFTRKGYEEFSMGKLDKLEGQFFELVQTNTMLGAGKQARDNYGRRRTSDYSEFSKNAASTKMDITTRLLTYQHERSMLWKHSVDLARQESRRKKVENEMGKCTFKPLVLQKPKLVERHWHRRQSQMRNIEKSSNIVPGQSNVFRRLHNCEIGKVVSQEGEQEGHRHNETLSLLQKDIIRQKNNSASKDHIDRHRIARKHREQTQKFLEEGVFSPKVLRECAKRNQGKKKVVEHNRQTSKQFPRNKNVCAKGQRGKVDSKSTRDCHYDEKGQETNSQKEEDVMMVTIRFYRNNIITGEKEISFGAASIGCGERPGEVVDNFVRLHNVDASQYNKLYTSIVQVMLKSGALQCPFKPSQLLFAKKRLAPLLDIRLKSKAKVQEIVQKSNTNPQMVKEDWSSSLFADEAATNQLARRRNESNESILERKEGEESELSVPVESWKQWWSRYRKRRSTVEALVVEHSTLNLEQDLPSEPHIGKYVDRKYQQYNVSSGSVDTSEKNAAIERNNEVLMMPLTNNEKQVGDKQDAFVGMTYQGNVHHIDPDWETILSSV